MKKLEGRAKAMVVTHSRADAVRYKLALDKLLAEKYNNAFKTLVAFSGVVDLNDAKYTEESMNGYGIKDNAIKIQFEEPEYKILIVAEKFQTGFDQPLLHTMFVDKLMGGIQCVQTLSRLNRCYPGKEDTLVIDFVNKHEDIYAAFKDYYEATYLDGHKEEGLYRIEKNRSIRLTSKRDIFTLLRTDNQLSAFAADGVYTVCPKGLK
jgi:type I restriction enzyme R subunit